MFKWLSKKIINSYVKELIKDIKDKDLKEKVIDYVKEEAEELLEKIKKVIKDKITKYLAKFQDKA